MQATLCRGSADREVSESSNRVFQSKCSALACAPLRWTCIALRDFFWTFTVLLGREFSLCGLELDHELFAVLPKVEPSRPRTPLRPHTEAQLGFFLGFPGEDGRVLPSHQRLVGVPPPLPMQSRASRSIRFTVWRIAAACRLCLTSGGNCLDSSCFRVSLAEASSSWVRPVSVDPARCFPTESQPRHVVVVDPK